MPLDRHFLGWDRPLSAGLREFLLPDDAVGVRDLSDRVVIVPTRQAGRRLRETLALACDARGTGLISPQIITPGTIFQWDESADAEASVALVKATWARVLGAIEIDRYGGLFPSGGPTSDFQWCLQTGEQMQALRAALVEGGLSVADVAGMGDAVEEEWQRWQDLADLERIYIEALSRSGHIDPHLGRLRAAERLAVPPATSCIILAAVPDPPTIAIKALERLVGETRIEVLVQAPVDLKDCFDAWGRPDREFWGSCEIPVGCASTDLILAGSPGSQGARVLDVIAREADRYGPGDVAVGVADREVIPPLEAGLAALGLKAYDPSERKLRDHPVCSLLGIYSELVVSPSYSAVRRFLREADVLRFLERHHDVSTSRLLPALDENQNRFLPGSLQGLVDSESRIAAVKGASAWPADLRTAVTYVQSLITAYRSSEAALSVQAFLRDVLRGRELRSDVPLDDEMSRACGVLNDALLSVAQGAVGELGLSGDETLAVLGRVVPDLEYAREREGAVIDLEGWLELAWNDAPLLIVTGMNEGRVPDGRLSDAFIPDSLRTRLQLKDDASRLARDAFIMRCCIESRRSSGRAAFICGKRSQSGDPLRPSRLMFRCPDDELPARASALFGPVDVERASAAATHAFQLNAEASRLARPVARPERISVTALSDYLACPFRFYLARVLGLEVINDSKDSPDALDYGNMVHAALEWMAGDSDLWRHADGDVLGQHLGQHVEGWARERYGAQPGMAMRVTLESAKARLAAAARQHVELVRDGWEIMGSEQKLELEVSGLTLVGKIDRIDRHRESRRIRVIDYKTSDQPVNPRQAHLRKWREGMPEISHADVGGSEYSWVDLQLPVYDLVLRRMHTVDRIDELAYFNLPKAVTETGVSAWSDFSDAHREAAEQCLERVLAAIRSGAFWPPAEAVRYDSIESMIVGSAATSFLPLAAEGGRTA
ncbi:MAG: PD-(D/E)XK nuclease family protein [Verrucomicrobia bacterium]|nr:PD-(D/E)XK nuclease family protein [Verrucomicrobiota bacterium]MDA1087241.1 PD-(D/E)XK nuclease family protein [Verrucomicrobiota bacterium]